MDDSVFLTIGILLFLLIAGSFFSASETAFTSANKIRLKNHADDGDKRASRALSVTDSIDKALTTLLILSNVTHIGIASLGTVLAMSLWGANAVSIMTAAMTIVVFLFAETIPKNYAANHAESFAMSVSGIISSLMFLLTPVTFLFSFISKLVTMLIAADNGPTVKEEELFDIIETIQEEGGMQKDKGELIQSALEFDDINVEDILTPRIDIVAIDSEDTPEQILNIIKRTRHSRLPVYEDTIDKITGILSIRKYIRSYLNFKEKTSLAELTEEVFFTPRTVAIDELLRDMSARKLNMAVVTDDYGGTLGIVTIEDILEELVGEIWDEDDVVRRDFVPTGGNRYEVSGDLSASDAFDMAEYRDYDAEDFGRKTMGAWALENFDYMPEEGDKFRYKNAVVTVQKIVHNRIVKLQLKITDGDAEEGASEE